MGQLPAYLCSDCGSPTLPCAEAPSAKTWPCGGKAPSGYSGTAPSTAMRSPDSPRPTERWAHSTTTRSSSSTTNPTWPVTSELQASQARASLPRRPSPISQHLPSEVLSARSLVVTPAPPPPVMGLRSWVAARWPPEDSAWPAAPLVVTALGAALGGALGASVTNAYVREDKSFHIEMLQGGPGVPVVVCNGFLSESGKGWGEWQDIITSDILTHLSTGSIGAPRNSRTWESSVATGQQGSPAGAALKKAAASREEGGEEAWPARPRSVRCRAGQEPLARRQEPRRKDRGHSGRPACPHQCGVLRAGGPQPRRAGRW